jgi:AcrR family transcriptional regulator
LIREKGLWSIRISDVAKRAGMSPANVVYYFGSKDQLFAEAISDADDAFYTQVDEELPRLQRASDRLGWLVACSSTSDWVLWVDMWVYARHHSDSLIAQRRFHDRWRRAFEDIIRHGIDTGEWHVDDPCGVAQRLCALTDGYAVHMTLGNPDHTPETYVKMVLTGAARELGCEVDTLLEAAARYPLEGGA